MPLSSYLENLIVNVATWNVASINNNPFEYWVTYPDEEYNNFMLSVENLLGDESQDVYLNQVFTNTMFVELLGEMEALQMSNLDVLSAMWSEDYSKRRAIQGFLKDRSIGEKRLTSMPDRITNTISLADGSKIMRPSVINAYQERLLLNGIYTIQTFEFIHSYL